jgi:aspartyl aminopeptidase
VAAYTDSLCPKVKPVSVASKARYLNMGVQTYGARLWHTWFDREFEHCWAGAFEKEKWGCGTRAREGGVSNYAHTHFGYSP